MGWASEETNSGDCVVVGGMLVDGNLLARPGKRGSSSIYAVQCKWAKRYGHLKEAVRWWSMMREPLSSSKTIVRCTSSDENMPGGDSELSHIPSAVLGSRSSGRSILHRGIL